MMMGRKGGYIYIEYYYSMKTFGLDFWENMCWFTASTKNDHGNALPVDFTT